MARKCIKSDYSRSHGFLTDGSAGLHPDQVDQSGGHQVSAATWRMAGYGNCTCFETGRRGKWRVAPISAKEGREIAGKNSQQTTTNHLRG